MFPTQINFELPLTHKLAAEVLSENAQMYLQCAKCGWEDRANVLYGPPNPDILKEPCSRCGGKKRHPVRHMESLYGRCLDCGHDLAGMQVVPWDDRTCPNCRSHRLDIEKMEITPPYPSTVGEVGDRSRLGTEFNTDMSKDKPWGVDAGSDAMHLQRETRLCVHLHPADSYQYIFCEFLFGQSLLAANQYPDDDKNLAQFVSMVGSCARDCFRQTRHLLSGLTSLKFDEIAVELEKYPPNIAAWQHNAAIMINTLLTRYPEDVIAHATERPEIRKEGIQYAVQALRFYVKEAEKESKKAARRKKQPQPEEEPEGLTCAMQAARTYHLIGDLLRTGNATNEERRQALEAYGQALEWKLPEKLLPGLLQSRGETTLMLEDATPEELAAAWQDLQAALGADTKRLGRSMPWAVLWHMAQIAERLDDRETELETLDKAARVAMAVLRQSLDEQGIQAQSEPMAPLFDSLALRYAQQDQPVPALSASEALRAATVRVHTKTKKQQFEDMMKMAGAAGADLARAHLRQAGYEVDPLQSILSDDSASIDSVEPAISRLLSRSGKTRTAIVSFSNPVWRSGSYDVAAFICSKSGSKSPTIQCQILHPGPESLRWDADLVRPGPFRESRLRRMHAAVFDAFLAPLLPALDALQPKRIVFSLPSVLSPYAFEALSAGKADNNILIRNCEVAYLPSIGFAQDEPRRASKQEGNLLVVGYQGDDLTNAAEEVEQLRRLFGPRMTLLSGKDCNKAVVLQHLAQPYDYIHFVCHGTYDEASPLSAALHLVPDVEDDSQRVTAADIFDGVKLPNRPLITMSACSTALMSASPVNNCHGLTGGFLRAGARAVVGSRWPVYDLTSAGFMSSLYENIVAGDHASPLACLTAVQRELAQDHGIEDFASFGYMGAP